MGRSGCVCCGTKVATGDDCETVVGSVCICCDGLVSPTDSVGLEIHGGRQPAFESAKSGRIDDADIDRLDYMHVTVIAPMYKFRRTCSH